MSKFWYFISGVALGLAFMMDNKAMLIINIINIVIFVLVDFYTVNKKQ